MVGLAVLVLVVALVAAQCTRQTAQAPQQARTYKLAAIFPGVVSDADYNTLGYLATTSVKSDLGIETAYSENVAVPDVERVMREYIDNGFNIIWTHGGQFINQTRDLARQFSEVAFIGETDGELPDMPPNLWVIDRNFQVGFYPLGALAAKATRSGRIGYIGGLSLPFSYMEVHAMRQAISDLGATVNLRTVWVGDFNDPTRARAIADVMIGEGVDVLVGSLNLGMLGIFEAAKRSQRKVLVTGKYTDKSSFAPEHTITSVLYDFAGPLKEITAKIRAGETGGYYPLGFHTGVALQMPLRNVPAALGGEIEQIVADVREGKVTVVKDATPVR
jgi:basic membrane protein A